MIDLVLVYNHKYESNIPKLERFYAGKFRRIWHLVPFYRGTAENVIPVYEGSFYFEGFIAQAAKRLMVDPPEHFFFLGDDLLLDPAITQANILSEFGVREKDCGFIGELHDLSKGQYARGVREARLASFDHPGLEIKGELPEAGDALARITRHMALESLVLRNYMPYLRKMEKPYGKNMAANWSRCKGNVWHLREQFRHWIKPKTMPYPLLGGYSDLFIVPTTVFEEFAHYCGVLAAAKVFVELAIPTALAFVCPQLVTEDKCPRRGLNVWFPPGPWEVMERKTELLNQITAQAEYKLPNLIANWPGYLYLHPLKMSKWSW